ncbi:MAG: hypothetical protein IT458_03660 [Planctomycetes bacterium]|nr:hypothetical protein [Planctomycetota bacterium]
MKKHSFALLGIASLVPSLAAQAPIYSPVGTSNLEGNGLSAVNFATYAASRMQYIDGNQRGAAAALAKMAFRRDGGQANTTTAGPRSIDISVLMGHADVSAAAPSTTFATNYNGPTTAVFTLKTVNVPDLNAKPPSPPAPFSLTLPFDVPFAYSGTLDLLWELASKNNTAAGTTYLDTATNGSTAFGGLGNFFYNGGVGCVVPPNTTQFDIISSAAATSAGGVTSIGWYALRGPVSSPGVLAIGISDPNLAGLFCAPLRTSAEIVLPINTDATGAIASSASRLTVSFPFPGTSFNVYSQFAALDTAAQKLYLSDATFHEVVPYAAPVIRKVYAIRNTTSDVAVSGTSSTFGIVVRFN